MPRRHLALIAAPLALAIGLSACSSTTSGNANAAGENPASATTVPAPQASSPANTAPVESSTTVAPTTAAPTTTLQPIVSVPSNVETVGEFPGEIKAVGSSSGPATQIIQLRLEQLGFWTGAHDGKYTFPTTQAVMAFQKYIGLKRTGKVDTTTAAYLKSIGERSRGSSNTGTLVEVDKTKQLAFIVQDGKTVWTFNTSTGSGIPYEAVNKKDPTKIEKGDAITPNGLFRVNRERPDGWWDGDLGQIYRPKYFKGGIAIHGMTSVPGYPASHGCVRLSTMAMDFIWDSGLVPVGTPVWVHE